MVRSIGVASGGIDQLANKFINTLYLIIFRAMSQDERNINDEIHGSIPIPPAVHAILDTVPVQRLGSLHQLGCASLTCQFVYCIIGL